MRAGSRRSRFTSITGSPILATFRDRNPGAAENAIFSGVGLNRARQHQVKIFINKLSRLQECECVFTDIPHMPAPESASCAVPVRKATPEGSDKPPRSRGSAVGIRGEPGATNGSFRPLRLGSSRSASVKSFGRWQASESPRRTNPRSSRRRAMGIWWSGSGGADGRGWWMGDWRG